MPRQAFTRVAKDVGCQLYFPYPGDQVVVLRTGMLMHLKAYMQVWLFFCFALCFLRCLQRKDKG